MSNPTPANPAPKVAAPWNNPNLPDSGEKVSSIKVTIKADPRPKATSANPEVNGLLAAPWVNPNKSSSIDIFASKIQGQGVQRQNKYAVFLGAVPGAGKSDNVTIMAESVSFPGQNVRSVPDVIRHGPEREQAQGMTYGDFNITFICTPGMPEKKYFENWQEAVVNKITWEPKYYDNYIAGEMRLLALSEEEDERYIVHIKEAYPKTVAPQSFSYGSNDSYQTIDVEFSYRSWESEIITSPFSGIANWADTLSGQMLGQHLDSVDTPSLNVNLFSDIINGDVAAAVDAFSSLSAAAVSIGDGTTPTPAQPVSQSVNPHSVPAPTSNSNKPSADPAGSNSPSAEWANPNTSSGSNSPSAEWVNPNR